MAHNSNDLVLVDVEPAGNTVTRPRVKSRGRRDSTSGRPVLKRQKRSRWSGVVLGTLAAGDEAGNPRVDYPGNPVKAPLEARTTVPLSQAAPGQPVALMFVE